MNDVTIRDEGPDDYAAIDEVVESAFGSPAEARLVHAIRTSALAVPELSLVAEQDRRIVGHVMVSFAEVINSDERRPIAMLSPLAVAPDRQRQGIGSLLVRARHGTGRRAWRERRRAGGQPGVLRTARFRAGRCLRSHAPVAVLGAPGGRPDPPPRRRCISPPRSRRLPAGVRHPRRELIRTHVSRDDSTQNSLPCGSARTVHVSSGP